nr:radical SAM protein [uncultured Sellimonas sp.]
MDRYSKITNKNQREIVLLKGHPCVWGKCRFCDYIDDNSRDTDAIVQLNREILSSITGEFGVLEVINSGSCFELPKQTLEDIRKIVQEKGIKKLFFEAHWIYKNRLDEMREFFGIPIIYKTGAETFDYDFREHYLNKHADFKDAEELSRYFDSPCLMVGIKGQTKEMIRYDIECLKKYFRLGTINVFTNNTTDVKRDDELIKWFLKEYRYLEDDPSIEVLYENTDFGVGD